MRLMSVCVCVWDLPCAKNLLILLKEKKLELQKKKFMSHKGIIIIKNKFNWKWAIFDDDYNNVDGLEKKRMNPWSKLIGEKHNREQKT